LIKALILLGFTDSYGGQLEYLKSININNEKILKEAKELIDSKNPLKLLSNLYINWGELPQSARSYYDFMQDNSELSKILPLAKKVELIEFKKIYIPILGIVGDHNECTVIKPQEAVNLLNKANKNAQCFMIENCEHSYTGREKELVSIIRKFLKEFF